MTRPLTKIESEVLETARLKNDRGHTTNDAQCVPELKSSDRLGYRQYSKRHKAAWDELVEDGFFIEVPPNPRGGGYVVAGHPLLKEIADLIDFAQEQQTIDRLQKKLTEAQLRLTRLQDFKRKYQK